MGGHGESSKDDANEASQSPAKPEKLMDYELGVVLGHGSFGIVCAARKVDTNTLVAIKRVLQDPRYKNRELDIMKNIHHPNIVDIKDNFFTNETEAKEKMAPGLYLNLVMEHMPETVHRVLRTCVRKSERLSNLSIKLYIFQLCRALGYLHCLNICHRDVKPQNLLVNPETHRLKLCDFGSAKPNVEGEISVSYICSRYYRAPELMLGCTRYSTAIDTWSIGCVLGELILGRPLFAGETSVDQLVKIIQVLGTPTAKDMRAMNPEYTEFRFPEIPIGEWRKVLESRVDDDVISLLQMILRYDPKSRITPLEALSHRYFDELRKESTRLPNGKPLPDLFTFTEEEQKSIPVPMLRKILPVFLQTNGSIKLPAVSGT